VGTEFPLNSTLTKSSATFLGSHLSPTFFGGISIQNIDMDKGLLRIVETFQFLGWRQQVFIYLPVFQWQFIFNCRLMLHDMAPLAVEEMAQGVQNTGVRDTQVPITCQILQHLARNTDEPCDIGPIERPSMVGSSTLVVLVELFSKQIFHTHEQALKKETNALDVISVKA